MSPVPCLSFLPDAGAGTGECLDALVDELGVLAFLALDKLCLADFNAEVLVWQFCGCRPILPSPGCGRLDDMTDY